MSIGKVDLRDAPKADPEEYVYRIKRVGGPHERKYRIDKTILDIHAETYYVRLKGNSVECSCPGFARQKYPAIDHKHVQIAQDFHEVGEPNNAEYRIDGVGANATIRRVRPQTNDT